MPATRRRRPTLREGCAGAVQGVVQVEGSALAGGSRGSSAACRYHAEVDATEAGRDGHRGAAHISDSSPARRACNAEFGAG